MRQRRPEIPYPPRALARISHHPTAAGAEPLAGEKCGLERRYAIERRHRHPLLASWRCAYEGRRRTGRREGDLDGAVLDWYSADLLFVAVSILALCVCDAAITLHAVGLGLAAEANPLMAVLLAGGSRLFVGLKVLATGLGVVGLVIYSNLAIGRRLPLARVLYWLLGVYLTLVIYEIVMLQIMGM